MNTNHLIRRLPSKVNQPSSTSKMRARQVTVKLKLANKLPRIEMLILALLLIAHSAASGLSEMAPRITIQPSDLVAIEGESAELNCDAEGEPEPSIEWYHNGQLIKASTHSRTTMAGSIQFLDIRPPTPTSTATSNSKPSDTGIYYCLARNSLGQARSRNASLQVAYIKQEFRLAPKDKLVSIGDTATFDCLPQASPEPRIQWRHNDQLIDPNESRLADGSAKYTINKIAKTDSNIPPDKLQSASDELTAEGSAISSLNKQLIDVFGSQLVIRQVDKNDEGKYSCLVETKGSHRLIERASPEGHLSALVKPYFIEAPEHKTVQVGGQVKLRCRMSGDPEPVISWRKQNGQPLSEKTQIDPVDKTLTIDQLTVADHATYVCEGENSVGSARAMATVSVNSRPKFIIQPEDQEVDRGTRVVFKCTGEASPHPMLFWYKEGHRQLMFATSNPTTKQQTSLDWPQASPLIATDYRSTSDTSPSINKLFSLPISPDQLDATNYGNNYFGNRIYVDNQGSLNIINATFSDNGYYACALISSVGSVMAKARLTVRQSPDIPLAGSDIYNSAYLQDSAQKSSLLSSKFELLPPPVIKLGSSNQTLPTNTSAVLVCDVVSQVAYKIQWFFEQQPLQEEQSRVLVMDTGALSINNLRPSDSGIYTCVVTAANDQAPPIAAPFEPLDSSMLTSAPPIQQFTSHSSALKVASPMNPNIQFYRMDTFAYPSSPGTAYLVSTPGNDAVAIAWSAPADSGTLPIKEYIVEHYDTSQEHLGWREIYRIKGKESLLVDGLSSDGSHFFVIRAANSHGTGPSSAIAGPMRTVAGEAHYQAENQRRRQSGPKRVNLENSLTNNMRENVNLARERLMTISTNLMSLTPVSSTSIRLQWSTQISGNSSSVQSPEAGIDFPILSAPDVNDFLEGYSIRYRPIGMGESLLNRDPILGTNWNIWSAKDANIPSSLPLVTSYVEEDSNVRKKRESTNYFDYSQEFSEIRVIDHNTEHYTMNVLKPFTMYQFFVVPYYKDIDGVPSNILSAQTNEDRPSVAPPNLTIRPINNTAVRLLWLHVPPILANGILRGYVAQINRSDLLNNNPQQLEQQSTKQTVKELNLPLGILNVAPSTAFNPDARLQPNPNSVQQYIVMYDLTNLTYKSFYSIQVAATTSVGSGPWSDPQNFVMDPQILSQRLPGNDFDDVMSKSLISTIPQTYGKLDFQNSNLTNIYLIVFIALLIISIIIVMSVVFYRRNNHNVITWKKTISEHFTNKFYMPSTVDHRGPNSLQQNIYDHQQHLIYSGSSNIAPQQAVPVQMWANNGCINSSGTGSLSSHGGLLPISTDPNNIGRRINGEQVILVNNKDMNQRFIKTNTGQPINQSNIDPSQTFSHQNQVTPHGDYYSVIGNMAEYEELDNQQRTNIQGMAGVERHQTASSNSDTSCPSSVTRLLPNQNYNRDMIGKTFIDNQQRHDMVLQQQQVAYNEGKQSFATMLNGEAGGISSMTPLSPYATTNLINQVSAPQHHHLFSNPQMSLVDHSRQQNFVLHNGNVTMDDSSKALINHHQVNGMHNPISVFRTLQRTPANFQSRGQQFSNVQPQIFMQQTDSNVARYQAQNHNQAQFNATKITSNPLSDIKSNLYEHIDYTDPSQSHPLQKFQQNNSQASNDIISSSTSSGSMKSTSQQQSPDQQQSNLSKFRRGSAQGNFEKESHDLHVFSSQHHPKQFEPANEKMNLNVNHSTEDNCEEDEINQIDETTAFRQKASQSDNQRTRQLSKRKRQQQRNRLHNNNQKVDY